jgi:hypothetical protein
MRVPGEPALLGVFQTALKDRPNVIVKDELGSEQLQSALPEEHWDGVAKGRSSILIPSATFQRISKSARALASSSDARSCACSSKAVAKRLGGTLLRPLSGQPVLSARVRIQPAKVLIPKQVPSLSGQEAIERVPPNEIEVHMIRFKHSALRGSLPKHQALLSSPPMTTRGLDRRFTFRPDF